MLLAGVNVAQTGLVLRFHIVAVDVGAAEDDALRASEHRQQVDTTASGVSIW